jgi:hypothetical protein
MLQAGGAVPVRVRQEDLDVHRPLGERDLETVLESPLHAGGLLFHLPFLEQGGEGIGIQALPRLRVQDADLAVALQQRRGQVVPPAGPYGSLQGLLEIDGLVRVVPAEHVVQPQGGVLEVLVEVPGRETRQGQEKGDDGQKNLFHQSWFCMTRLTAASTSS